MMIIAKLKTFSTKVSQLKHNQTKVTSLEGKLAYKIKTFHLILEKRDVQAQQG